LGSYGHARELFDKVDYKPYARGTLEEKKVKTRSSYISTEQKLYLFERCIIPSQAKHLYIKHQPMILYTCTTSRLSFASVGLGPEISGHG
jgi:hypothetical protein